MAPPNAMDGWGSRLINVWGKLWQAGRVKHPLQTSQPNCLVPGLVPVWQVAASGDDDSVLQAVKGRWQSFGQCRYRRGLQISSRSVVCRPLLGSNLFGQAS